MTLRTVALHAGVSKSVVSRVLQGSSHVSDYRRAAVEKAIRDLGYRPNGVARSLTQRRSGAVGVLINDLRQPWLVDFLEGLNVSLHATDLHALIGDGRLDRATDERLLRAFMEMRVDGLILAGSMPLSTTISEAAGRLPTVVAGSRDIDMPFVDVIAEDDWLGAELAMAHLFDIGHRRIAHIAGPSPRVFELRRQSYETFMTQHGLADRATIADCDATEPGGYQAALQILDQAPATRPTAVFAANDLACLGAIAAANDLGLQVPRDVSMVGFDNSSLAGLRQISLTSVDVAATEVGRLSAARIVERIANPSQPARQHFITPRLVVRQSTAHPRQ